MSTAIELKRSRFDRMLLRTLVLPAMVLAGLAVVFLLLIRLLLTGSEWVDHSDRVISTAHRSQGLLVDMETGVRGYLLTRDPLFLKPYEAAVPHVGRAFAYLKSLVRDSQPRTVAVESLSSEYKAWHLTATQMLAPSQPGSIPDRALQLKEKTEMEELRAGFAEFIAAEETLRIEREAHVRTVTTFAVVASLLTVLLIGLIVGAAGRRALRELSVSYEDAIRISAEEQRRTEESERKAQFLAEASNLLASSLDYEVILRKLATLPVPAFADWCAIDIVHSGAEIERVAAAHSNPKLVPDVMALGLNHRASQDDDTIIAVTRSGKAEVIENISQERLERVFQGSQLALVKALNPHSLIVAPIRGHHAVHGALTLVSAGERRYTASDLPFVEDLGRRAATAIENSRLYREASVANRAKDEFLATLSHELRTPLTSVVGWASLLRAGGLDEPTQQMAIETILQSARAQTEMIEELLDLSRIDMGRLDLELKEINFPQLVHEVVDSVRPAANAKGIRVELKANVVLIVRGDSRRLRQIVWNLLSNATKFTPPAGVISVEVVHHGSLVRLTVKDSGIGLDSEALSHVWERFWQADGRASRQHGGLGLGLAVVRNFAELHGGSVSAASDGPGRGAVFSVELPAISQGAVAETDSDDGEVRLDGARVLLVDDEPEARLMLATALIQFGCVVQAAESVAEALSVLASWQPTMLISDIGMPGEDGISLIRRIRGSAVASDRTLPAIALTAYARPEDRARALGAGFTLHLAKPVDPLTLARAVHALHQRPRRKSSG